MPKFTEHAPGTFCWFELATTDQPGAKSFYSSLFGWTANDSPLGPGEVYTMFQNDGATAAAAYNMPQAEAATAPPHWNLYIAVANADDSAKRAAELGGKILAGPFDVMTAGRMAVVQDPTGAIFAIWQAGNTAGAGVKHEDGAVCWADLSSPDPSRAQQFYEALFGWNIGPAPGTPPDYLIVQQDGQRMAGIGPMRQPGVPPHWGLFFMHADVDAAAVKAKELGGKELMPPTAMGPTRLAVLADPQGAVFSIIRPPR